LEIHMHTSIRRVIPGIIAAAGIVALAVGIGLTASAASDRAEALRQADAYAVAMTPTPRDHGEPCTLQLSGDAEDPSWYRIHPGNGFVMNVQSHSRVDVCPDTRGVEQINVEVDRSLGRWTGEARSFSGDVAEWYYVHDLARTRTTVTATVLDGRVRVSVDTQPLS